MLRHWTMLCGLTSLTTEQIGKLITKPQDLRSGSRQVRTLYNYDCTFECAYVHVFMSFF